MKLKDYIDEKNLSVCDVARDIGVYRQTIYDWINGDAMPNYINRVEVMRYTKGQVTSIDMILTDEEIELIKKYRPKFEYL